ncbi:MAG: type II toxin-antitoxin system RelE/ParE family toxin [Azospirillaceae bacterium]|nr:type II toxin-antitoxin system RelE/ParE family toxin [Azospirillaceae bacterium]
MNSSCGRLRRPCRRRRDLLAAARTLRDGVAQAAGRIGEHPRIGSERPDLADSPYRFLVPAGFAYIVIYNAERHPPLIVRILHGARDLPEALWAEQ